MSQVSRVTTKTYFNTGDIPTEAQYGNTLDSIPFYDDLTFVDLPGLTWDGSYRSKTLSSNTALTLSSTKKLGVLIIKQDGTGSRTLSIGGQSVTINTAANSKTVIEAIFQETDSTYVIVANTNVVGVSGGDVTAPTLLTATIENANASRIILTYNETLDSGSVPATSAYAVDVAASPVAVTAVSISGAEVRVDIATPVTAGQGVTIDYSVPGSNKVRDVATNNAAGLSGQTVTNNVSGGVTWAGLPWFTRHKVVAIPHASMTIRTSGPDNFVQRVADTSGTSGHGSPSVYDITALGATSEEPKHIAVAFDGQPAMDINSPIGNQIYNAGSFSPLLSFPLTRAAVVRFPSLPGGNLYFLYNVASGALMDAALLGATSGNLMIYAGGGIIDTGFAPAATTTYCVWIERDLDKTTRTYVNNVLRNTTVDTGHTQFAGEKIGEGSGSGCRVYYADGGIIPTVVSSGDRTAAYNNLKTIFTSLP